MAFIMQPWELDTKANSQALSACCSSESSAIRPAQFSRRARARQSALSQLREMREVLRREAAWAREHGFTKLCFYQQIPTAVVFRGGNEFELFGGKVNDAVVSFAVIVTRRRRMRVVVRGDPSGGIDRTVKYGLQFGLFASVHVDRCKDRVVFVSTYSPTTTTLPTKFL